MPDRCCPFAGRRIYKEVVEQYATESPLERSVYEPQHSTCVCTGRLHHKRERDVSSRKHRLTEEQSSFKAAAYTTVVKYK